MMHSLRGAVFAIGFIALNAAYTAIDRTMNYKAAKAAVIEISRECKYTRVYTDGHRETATESCFATDEFEAIAASTKRPKNVDGKAVVTVRYASPQDGSYQTSKLRFDGRDDEFYKLKLGDEIDILISNDDPTKVKTG